MVTGKHRTLYPRERDTISTVQEARWAGLEGGAEYLAPTGIRFPDRPTRSESLSLSLSIYIYIYIYPKLLNTIR